MTAAYRLTVWTLGLLLISGFEIARAEERACAFDVISERPAMLTGFEATRARFKR